MLLFWLNRSGLKQLLENVLFQRWFDFALLNNKVKRVCRQIAFIKLLLEIGQQHLKLLLQILNSLSNALLDNSKNLHQLVRVVKILVAQEVEHLHVFLDLIFLSLSVLELRGSLVNQCLREGAADGVQMINQTVL